MTGKRVLVVDIDGVLHRGSLPAKWHERAVKSLELEDETYNTYRETRKEYRQGRCSSQSHGTSFVNSWIKAIVGMDYSKAIQIATELVKNEGFDNFIFTSNLVRIAKTNQVTTVAISRCPVFILNEYNKLFQFDYVIGADWDVSSGHFSGIVHNPGIFDDKRGQLERCFQEHVHSVDFENSIGIGDTQGDVEWLDLFGLRIAFNPDGPLLIHARNNPQSYMVVHEHKDIVICPQYEDVISPQILAQRCMDRVPCRYRG